MNKALENFKHSVNGKTIGVIGIGVSNVPLIRLLVKYGANVVARDKKSKEALGEIYNEMQSLGVKMILGEEYLENINEYMIFKTPGLRFDVPELNTARENGCIVTSEMEIFFDICPTDIIAVTGSDGKTTTTTLIYEMLKEEGYNCYLGGNIGKPLIGEVENITKNDKVILELSSFQLHTMKKSPHIAVITNLSPNHLDYHKGMEEYVCAKKNIFLHQKQGDKLILNYDNELSKNLEREALNPVFFSRLSKIKDGFFINDGYICYNDDKILKTSDILLPGVHNIENYMTAIATVWGMVSKDTIEKVAKTFGGVKHRIEFVRELDGVKYYNDSIASSPTRAKAGLYSFNQKIVLIAGGYDKKIPFDDFGYDIVQRVKCLVLIGATSDKIESAVKNASTYKGEPEIIKADSFYDAVVKARENAESGDIVMLSPACASFDLFKNFEERGNLFKQYVMELK